MIKNSNSSLNLVYSIFTDVLQKHEKNLKVYVNEDVRDRENRPNVRLESIKMFNLDW